jgi:pyrimidine operon attenuation protein/uracil phosphoribosyltransferase
MTVVEKNKAIEEIIGLMASELKTLVKERDRKNVAIIGIHSGGVWVAERLHKLLKIKDPLGELNIAFYRDDFSQIGMHPSVEPSNLPFDVEGRDVILVDDILYTGRTIRAALNEIFDYGRPASVTLAVLVDRGEQQLPFKADVVGTTMSLSAGEHVKLTGPKTLSLVTK